jgi:formate hydrogenlyase subunit 4
MTMPEFSSWVFRFVPYAVLASTVAFALVVPTLVVGALPPALTAVFLAVGLLALASSFMVLGGLDTSSAFGSMGSSREMTLVALSEAAFLVILATLGLVAGTGSLDHILMTFAAAPWMYLEVLLSPTIVAFLFVVLAENTRYPVDNPATHLELTMVHEAMLLEYSGPYLAMLEYASMLRLTVMGVFFANVLAPIALITPAAGPTELAFGALAFVVKLGCFAFLVASIESLIVKMRFYRMQEYFSLAFLFALAGAATVLLQIAFK